MSDATFIAEIEDAWDALVKSHSRSLAAALKLGEVLIRAKDGVGHGDWTKWLEKNVTQFSHRTADVYMKLAKNKFKFEAEANSQRAAILGAKDMLSIRGAIEAINKADGGGIEAGTGKGGKGKGKGKGGGKGKSTSKSATDMADVDTLVDTFKSFTPMQRRDFIERNSEELASAPPKSLVEQLAALSISDAVETITDAFEPEQLKALVEGICSLVPEAKAEEEEDEATPPPPNHQPELHRRSI